MRHQGMIKSPALVWGLLARVTSHSVDTEPQTLNTKISHDWLESFPVGGP